MCLILFTDGDCFKKPNWDSLASATHYAQSRQLRMPLIPWIYQIVKPHWPGSNPPCSTALMAKALGGKTT